MARYNYALGLCAVFALNLSPSAMGDTTLPDLDRQLARDSNEAYQGPTYVSFLAGYAMATDADLNDVGGLSITDVEIDLDDAPALGGAIGIFQGGKGGGMRFELEGVYREFDIDGISGLGSTSGSGDLETWTIMGNAYMDFYLTDRWKLYVGGGLGAINLQGDITVSDGTTTITESGDEWEFAYQAMAGLSWNFLDNLTATAGYRLLMFNDPSFGAATFDSPLIHGPEIGIRLSF